MLLSVVKDIPDANNATSGRSEAMRALVVEDDACLLQVVHQMLDFQTI
jgi:hypothetical protein